MRKVVFSLLGFLVVVLAFATPIVLSIKQRGKHRHVGVVREGVLYRSAQFAPGPLHSFVWDKGIRTIVNLRDGSTADDVYEEKYCRHQGIRFVRIGPLSCQGSPGTTPIDEGLQKFLQIVADPSNHPVLVHCYRGVHRTGMYVAIYRVEFENWSLADAIAEMVANGYDTLEDHADVRAYLASYRRSGRYQLPPRVLALAKPGQLPR